MLWYKNIKNKNIKLVNDQRHKNHYQIEEMIIILEKLDYIFYILYYEKNINKNYAKHHYQDDHQHSNGRNIYVELLMILSMWIKIFTNQNFLCT